MNDKHWPAGTPLGGQFMPKEAVGVVRGERMQNDVQYYTDDFGRGNEEERIRRINDSLYDGGYLTEKKGNLAGFRSAEEAEHFIEAITSKHFSDEAWKKHKNLVKNYVNVALGYIQRGKFDLVLDGTNSSDGSTRIAEDLIGEFGWTKEDVQETLVNSLTAENFVGSGNNNSSYYCNQGTVVMIFSPRIEVSKPVSVDKKTGLTVKRRQVVDLYIKMVLNPHPDRNRHQTEMQILSFREAGETELTKSKQPKDSKKTKDKVRVCLYTGEEHRSRADWKRAKFRDHKDRPILRMKM